MGLPGVMGAIDGTHIPIKAPRHRHEQYINRKGFFSVQLEVICDPGLFITDVFCGYPGSVHAWRRMAFVLNKDIYLLAVIN